MDWSPLSERLNFESNMASSMALEEVSIFKDLDRVFAMSSWVAIHFSNTGDHRAGYEGGSGKAALMSKCVEFGAADSILRGV